VVLKRHVLDERDVLNGISHRPVLFVIYSLHRVRI